MVHVQDVAVDASTPDCFWSAGEDGRVHQFDVRLKHIGPDANNMLIRAPTRFSGGLVQFKSLDICKVRADLRLLVPRFLVYGV
jgi:hypothetical protein